MTRHNIVGSEAGRALAPGIGSLSSLSPSRRRSSMILPISCAVALSLAVAAGGMALLHHPL